MLLDTFPVALTAGVLLGYLAGIGVGGGSLLILWLTLALGTEGTDARAINLMFFIASAGAVSIFRWRQGTLHLRAIFPAILAGCCFAALFSWISTLIDTSRLRKLFGLLLLGTGFRELCYRPRKAR